MKIIANGSYITTDKPEDHAQLEPKVVAETDFPVHVCFTYYTKTGIGKQKIFKRSVYKLFQSDLGLIRKMKIAPGVYHKNEVWCIDTDTWFHTQRDFDLFCTEFDMPIQKCTYPFEYYTVQDKKQYYQPNTAVVLPPYVSFKYKAIEHMGSTAMSYAEFYSLNHLSIFKSGIQLPVKSKYSITHVVGETFYMHKYVEGKLYPSQIKSFVLDMEIITKLIPKAKGVILSNTEYKGELPEAIIVEVLQ
jgi:hypothetical protein